MWFELLRGKYNCLEQGKRFLWVQYVQGVSQTVFSNLPLWVSAETFSEGWSIDPYPLECQKQKSGLKGPCWFNQRADHWVWRAGKVDELCTCKLQVSTFNPCYYHRNWFRDSFRDQWSMQCLHTNILLYFFWGEDAVWGIRLRTSHMLSNQSTVLLEMHGPLFPCRVQAGLELRNLLSAVITGMYHHYAWLSADLKPTLDYLLYQI